MIKIGALLKVSASVNTIILIMSGSYTRFFDAINSNPDFASWYRCGFAFY